MEETGFRILYLLGVMLMPCMIYQTLAYALKDRRQQMPKHLFLTGIFLLYLFAALYLAGIGTVWDIGRYDTVIRMDEINLIPFHSQSVRDDILNVIMFLPLGFLLPAIWQEMRKAKRTAAAGFLFSLLIELCQLTNTRATDVDDLIMNTVGAFAGYLLWLAFCHVQQNHEKTTEELSHYEPVIYLFLTVAGVFLLYDPWLVQAYSLGVV